MLYDTLNVSEIYLKTHISKSKGTEIANCTHGLKAKLGKQTLRKNQMDPVKKNIVTFPVIESHCLREETTRQFYQI